MSRVAVLHEQGILDSPQFAEDLQAVAAPLRKSAEESRQYAANCLRELAVRPEDRYLKRVVKLARFMTTRSYEQQLDLNLSEMDRLKTLSGKHPLVFLWSHKSHLDSFVFLRAMYDSHFCPQPLSFAGINMNFMGFGSLAKRSGAIFLRRSFKDDPIYKLVLKHYIDYLVTQGVPLSWSIEGTRSRTGKLMPPKLGLLQWVLESYERTGREDALLVPVSISFDQIAEMGDFVAMQQGRPKRKESLRWFLDYIRGMSTPYGKIYVRFAEPVSLAETVSVSANLFDDADSPQRIQLQKLAFEVSNRIEHVSPIKLTDLVTLILLCANETALTADELHSHAAQIEALIAHGKLPTAGRVSLDLGDDLTTTLAALTRTSLLQCHDKGSRAVFRIAPGKQLAAAYYRNTVIHYFLNSAMAELALAMSVQHSKPTPKLLWDNAAQLRDLLKFEFFFKTKAQFKLDISDYLSLRYPRWQMALQVPSERTALLRVKPPLFGHGILRSFLEAYLVLANVLEFHGDDQDKGAKGIVARCLNQGKQMLWRREISSAAALSKPLFKNAVRLAEHRGLVSGDVEDHATDRSRFRQQVEDAVSAVNLLQHYYDETRTDDGTVD